MKTNFSPRILVAALVLALGAGGTALAMSPEHCGAAGGRMEQRMGYHLQEMSRLHGDLKLDARQEALWQDAEQFSRSTMRDRGDQMRKQRAEVLASVSQPGADLRAVVKQMDELKDAGRQQHEASRDRWLAVYDSLDARAEGEGTPVHQEQTRTYAAGRPIRSRRTCPQLSGGRSRQFLPIRKRPPEDSPSATDGGAHR
jgi:protein CpxP